MRRRQHDRRRRLQRHLPRRAQLDLSVGGRVHANDIVRRRHDRSGRGVRRREQDRRRRLQRDLHRAGRPLHLHGRAARACELDLRQQARRAGRELRRRQRDGERRLQRDLPARAGLGLPGARLAVHARRRAAGTASCRSRSGEVCDDGNITEGDGCSAELQGDGRRLLCVPGMKCVCPQVRCGDGTIEGTEKCDDGNTNSGDGCSSTCTIERGYVCPLVKAPLRARLRRRHPHRQRAVRSRDHGRAERVLDARAAGIRATRARAARSASATPPSAATARRKAPRAATTATPCPYDGCSATCVPEPACPSAARPAPARASAATASCCPAKTCDDGNNLSGDGCSATLQVRVRVHVHAAAARRQHPGAGRLPRLQLPHAHRLRAGRDGPDGDHSRPRQHDAGRPTGKPVRSTTAYTYITSAATFAQWYTDVAGVNKTYARTMTLLEQRQAGGYVNRWGPNGEQWPITKMAYYCGNVGREMLDAAGNPIPCTSRDASSTRLPDPGRAGATRISCTMSGGNCGRRYQTGALDGTPTFFPIDDVPGAAAARPRRRQPPAALRSATGIWRCRRSRTTSASPARSATGSPTTRAKSYTLDFLGDDDVWMFVNKKLAVDIGGIHTPQPETITISAANAGTFGLTNGNVYEVEVFQAERQTTSSSFKLTLSGFNAGTSACGPICGDRVVTPPEQCDNGTANNTGGYNKCTTDCKLGPFCGDAMVTDGEQCDNGTNGDAYGAMSGCGPGCKLPARCGDLIVQTEYGEQCDDGTNSGGYGGCTNQCQRGALLRRRQGAEPAGAVRRRRQRRHLRQLRRSDDAAAELPVRPALRRRRRAGRVRRAVRADVVQRSELHRRLQVSRAICGDGVKTPPEECDYGAVENNGAYGGCAPGCILAPHCGDARQERSRGVRRRRQRQQLRRVLAAVQAGRSLRRRHDQPALRAVRRRREQRPDRRVLDRLQVQHPVASLTADAAAASRQGLTARSADA